VTDPLASPPRQPRPLWPLYVAAGLSFFPVFGFFWGSVAVSWGLVSSRPGARRAVVIAATGALLNLIAMVVYLTSTAGKGTYQVGYQMGIRRGMGDIVAALEEYHSQLHHYPESLGALNQERGPLRAVPITDMGAGIFHVNVARSYQYSVAPDGLSYVLFSIGPDGEPGTDDDIRPLVPDSLEGKTGLHEP
jgi:hypothetical protein